MALLRQDNDMADDSNNTPPSSSLDYYYRGIKGAVGSAVRDEVAQDRATLHNIKRRGLIKGLMQGADPNDPYYRDTAPVPDHPRTSTERMRTRITDQAPTKRDRSSNPPPKRRAKSR